MKRRLLFISIALVMGILGSAAAFAQETADTPPSQINIALQDLSQRLGEEVTLGELQSYRWNAENFDSTALGCPQEGELYAQVLTEGWIFLIEYNNVAYDYRVSQDGNTVVLCSSDQEPVTCGENVIVEDGDTLYDIAQRCDTTVGAIVEANQNLQTRTEILFPGEELLIPDTLPVATPAPTEIPDTPGEIPDDTMQPVVAIYPTTGQPGTTVTAIANDLPPNTEVGVGLGRPFSEYDILRTETTTANGALFFEITIPEESSLDEAWVVVVNRPDGTEEYISDRFTTTP